MTSRNNQHVTGYRIGLQIDDARIGERRCADQLALQRPAERHGVVGVAEWQILPGAVERGGARHCGERQRPVVGEAVVGAGAEIRYGHPQRIAAAPSGVGEVPQVEQAIVEEAVIAANELHEARDRPGVLDFAPDPGRRPADGEVGQGADSATRGDAGKTVHGIESDARGCEACRRVDPPSALDRPARLDIGIPERGGSGEDPVRSQSGSSCAPVENDGDVPSRHRIRIRHPGRFDPAASPARWFGTYSIRARAAGQDRCPAAIADCAAGTTERRVAPGSRCGSHGEERRRPLPNIRRSCCAVSAPRCQAGVPPLFCSHGYRQRFQNQIPFDVSQGGADQPSGETAA